MSTPKLVLKKPIPKPSIKPSREEELLDKSSSSEHFPAVENLGKVPLTNNNVLHLQRTIGNAAVQRLLDNHQTIKHSTRGGASIQRLMTISQFKGKSRGPLWGAFTGKRDEVKKVEAALTKYHSATSKSVGLTDVINACDDYLNVAGRAGSRIAGVKALKLAAAKELAAWRLRVRDPMPQSVYRMDERTPEVIAGVGFQPWNPAGTVNIVEHVTQVLRTTKTDRPDGTSGAIGMGAKKHSQFVSTAGNLDFAKDPTLLAGLLNKYFYKITTTVNPANFNDVSKHFDDMGEPNPYETQFEWAHDGGIPPASVTQYFKGKDIVDMVIAGHIDPAAINWTDMPVLAPVLAVSGDIDGGSESDTDSESGAETESETH